MEKEYANDILAVFSNAVNVHELERAKIRSFLASNEFTPQLIQVINSAINPVSATDDHDKISLEDLPLGDILGIGRIFQLKDIKNAEDLSCQIIELGSLYTQARRYGMAKLVSEIRQKLQVTWNSYAGVSQLEPLLEVAQVAFEEDNNPPYDDLQDWLISFMADTYDLITTNENGAFFWQVFGADDVLKDTIFARRAENIRTMPERYQHLPTLLRSRGV